jgi:SWI/SNF-related matrix-associated actin-dependent regulator of chromatin subfamily A member 5
VFRFVTEGTVEEKIIERADRKLFLDAAVIQQGRIAEQNSSLEKGELMKMVRFGADQILSGKGGTYTDEDIDALIAKGAEKTALMQAKLETDAQHDLANFSLLGDDEVVDSFSFAGKNYRGVDKRPAAVSNFINLPQRQRKRVHDAISAEPVVPKKTESSRKKLKGPALHDFQLFDVDELDKILKKEKALEKQKEAEELAIQKLRKKVTDGKSGRDGALFEEVESREKKLLSLSLTEDESRKKAELLAEGFADWDRKDFRFFCASLERHGRYDFTNVCREVMSETGKERSEIARYFIAFWSNFESIEDGAKIVERIERGEKKLVRFRLTRDAIQEKVERHLEETFATLYRSSGNAPLPSLTDMIDCSWQTMKIQYPNGTRGKGFQDEEDAFLVCMMYRHGVGASERIRMEIRRAWQFRFNWWFKSRSTPEIQKRCEFLVRAIEKEIEDLHKIEDGEAKTSSPERVDELTS